MFIMTGKDKTDALRIALELHNMVDEFEKDLDFLVDPDVLAEMKKLNID